LLTCCPPALGNGWMLKLPGRLQVTAHRPTATPRSTSATGIGASGSPRRATTSSPARRPNCSATSRLPASAFVAGIPHRIADCHAAALAQFLGRVQPVACLLVLAELGLADDPLDRDLDAHDRGQHAVDVLGRRVAHLPGPRVAGAGLV